LYNLAKIGERNMNQSRQHELGNAINRIMFRADDLNGDAAKHGYAYQETTVAGDFGGISLEYGHNHLTNTSGWIATRWYPARNKNADIQSDVCETPEDALAEMVLRIRY
jgi:hypothetical protein